MIIFNDISPLVCTINSISSGPKCQIYIPDHVLGNVLSKTARYAAQMSVLENSTLYTVFHKY